MLIDCSYFTKGSRHIRNATLGSMPNANAKEVKEMIEAYIAENQEQFLVSMLGSVMGNKIHTYLICLDEDEEAKHIENLDSVCDKIKQSFADYVFFQILRDIGTDVSMTGVARLKNANIPVSPIIRQVNIWNSMVDRNRLLSTWFSSSECPVKGISISTEMLTKTNAFNL